MNDYKQMLLAAPDAQIDASAKALLVKWDEPPKALQILELLDHCVFCASASAYAINVLDIILDITCSAEGTTREKVVQLATWRQEPQ